MKLLNDKNLPGNSPKKVQTDEHADSSAVFINSPATPSPEDMELNEEQLDIISGGGDGSIILVKG